ncbi:MAG: hypothetical protein JRI37_03375 [Deltaproteobacteria bacterium]|nr:hypothetical protein [Deltaproteobacteria bacterium]
MFIRVHSRWIKTKENKTGEKNVNDEALWFFYTVDYGHGGIGRVQSGTGRQIPSKVSYHKGMAVFVHTKGGLMYEAAVGGQKFTFKAKP